MQIVACKSTGGAGRAKERKGYKIETSSSLPFTLESWEHGCCCWGGSQVAVMAVAGALGCPPHLLTLQRESLFLLSSHLPPLPSIAPHWKPTGKRGFPATRLL